MKIGILTGGGDAPGLNSVIYGVLLQAFEAGHEVIGIEKGWKGFMENITRPLNLADLDNLHTVGGTILFSTRTNPYKEVKKIEDPVEREKAIENTVKDMATRFKGLGIDALIAIGGDDTLGVAAGMYKHANAKVVGVPKTIDNDLSSTDHTFGFWTATQLATDAMDRLITTAGSHQRIFVVQVMGRDAGWLTATSGLATGAAIVLLPEKPFDMQKDVIKVLEKRCEKGFNHHIIAISEGAYPNADSLKRDFKTITQETIDNLPKDSFGNPLLVKLNLAKVLVEELGLQYELKTFFESKNVEYEVRDVVLGHTMRAGSPSSYDRILGLRFGMHAANLINQGDFGKMVCLRGEHIKSVPLTEGAKKKVIPKDSDMFKLIELMTRVKLQTKNQ
ncbi:MAG: 6-phosphofructokinase [Candidatus Hermodarchaeota archaeon]